MLDSSYQVQYSMGVPAALVQGFLGSGVNHTSNLSYSLVLSFFSSRSFHLALSAITLLLNYQLSHSCLECGKTSPKIYSRSEKDEEMKRRDLRSIINTTEYCNLKLLSVGKQLLKQGSELRSDSVYTKTAVKSGCSCNSQENV